MAKFLEFVEIDDYEGEKYHTFFEVNPETQPALQKLKEIFDRADMFEDFVGLKEADPRINEDTIGLLEHYSSNSYAKEFVLGSLSTEVVEKLSELENIEDDETLREELRDLFHRREGIDFV